MRDGLSCEVGYHARWVITQGGLSYEVATRGGSREVGHHARWVTRGTSHLVFHSLIFLHVLFVLPDYLFGFPQGYHFERDAERREISTVGRLEIKTHRITIFASNLVFSVVC